MAHVLNDDKSVWVLQYQRLSRLLSAERANHLDADGWPVSYDANWIRLFNGVRLNGEHAV